MTPDEAPRGELPALHVETPPAPDPRRDRAAAWLWNPRAPRLPGKA